MGLDMYLERHHKAVEGYLGEDLEDMKVNNPQGYALVKPYIVKRGQYIKWESLSEEVGYWRKANAIHRWFVENVQNGVDDCGTYSVSKAELEELLEICKELYEHKDDERFLPNENSPETLLPTQGGFFFGSTEYDEWYWEDIKSTIEILERVLSETDFTNQTITYNSSW